MSKTEKNDFEMLPQEDEVKIENEPCDREIADSVEENQEDAQDTSEEMEGMIEEFFRSCRKRRRKRFGRFSGNCGAGARGGFPRRFGR